MDCEMSRYRVLWWSYVGLDDLPRLAMASIGPYSHVLTILHAVNVETQRALLPHIT